MVIQYSYNSARKSLRNAIQRNRYLVVVIVVVVVVFDVVVVVVVFGCYY